MKMKLDMTKLKNLQAALTNAPVTKVGIIGSKASRQGFNNAEIGMRHEFGVGVPKRSFLRAPIIDQLQAKLDQAGFDGQTVFDDASQTGDLSQLVKEIGFVGEMVVGEGFQTGGFGKWEKHADGYVNNTGMILVDTTQLRDSISSEVV